MRKVFIAPIKRVHRRTSIACSCGGSKASSIAFHPAGVLVAGQLPTVRLPGGWTGGWTVRMSPSGASGTWRTVDSFNEGYPAAAKGIAVGANGWIYATGWAERLVGKRKSAARVKNWIVRRSTNGGATWTVVGSWAGSDTGASAAAIDAADGTIFVAGTTPDGGFVRRGTPGVNGTISWVISDDFQQTLSGSGFSGTRLNGITIDQATGEIFTIGGANDASGAYGGIGWGHWTVRKLSR